MPICPAGHQTDQTDFCDTCGLPIDASGPLSDSVAAPEAKTLECPNCHQANLPQALFCESCGYDFETGKVPDNPWARPVVPDVLTAEAAAEASVPETAQAAVPQPDGLPETDSASPMAEATPDAAPAAGQDHIEVNWVAELWIDPDWYALQGSPDPLPSVGLPDIVPLVRDQNLVGASTDPQAGRRLILGSQNGVGGPFARQTDRSGNALGRHNRRGLQR